MKLFLFDNLTHLTFGFCFNQPIILTNNLTHLTLGNIFNQQIELLNIKYLNISCNTMHLIENLPNSLKELILNNNFDLPLNDLPNQLKIMKILNNSYNKDLNNLPNSIEIIELNQNYNRPFINIPENLKLIKYYKNYKYLDLLNDHKFKYNLDFQIETFE